jgi:hypothetical protein
LTDPCALTNRVEMMHALACLSLDTILYSTHSTGGKLVRGTLGRLVV